MYPCSVCAPMDSVLDRKPVVLMPQTSVATRSILPSTRAANPEWRGASAQSSFANRRNRPDSYVSVTAWTDGPPRIMLPSGNESLFAP